MGGGAGGAGEEVGGVEEGDGEEEGGVGVTRLCGACCWVVWCLGCRCLVFLVSPLVSVAPRNVIS